MLKEIFYILNVSLLISCGAADNNKKKVQEPEAPESETVLSMQKDLQLNMNVLWDISDRIDDRKNPSAPPHYQRDIEAIKTLSEVFKKDMQLKGAYKAKSKIRVLFYPTPANNEINAIAKSFSYDLSSFNGAEANRKKKIVYDSITAQFERNAKTIYGLALNSNKAKQWDGSDIWRFFKNDVKDYCIEKTKGFRNILVIITDGYIYHRDSKDREKNRAAYVLPETLKPFRGNSQWRQLFNRGDYGLITTRKDLQDLEVLVLEITPSVEYKNDEDILKAYLTKWFREMGVAENNIACYNTDLPEYARKKIIDFINR
jgi:hypothetical protein